MALSLSLNCSTRESSALTLHFLKNYWHRDCSSFSHSFCRHHTYTKNGRGGAEWQHISRWADEVQLSRGQENSHKQSLLEEGPEEIGLKCGYRAGSSFNRQECQFAVTRDALAPVSRPESYLPWKQAALHFPPVQWQSIRGTALVMKIFQAASTDAVCLQFRIQAGGLFKNPAMWFLSAGISLKFAK